MLLVTCLLALPIADSARAQDAVTKPADSLALAAKELRAGNAERAKSLYEWVLHQDRKSTQARMGLGRVAVAQFEWGEGCDQFDEVMDRDTGNVGARYWGGICRREYGAQLAWLMRKRQWTKSMDNFLWVLARDSSYEDVLYQVALLHRYREEYDLALDVGRTQIERKPDLVSAGLGLFKLYRYVVAAVPPADLFPLLGRRRYALAAYFLGEALRRQGRYDESERLMNDILAHTESVPVQAIYSTLSRIYFARGDASRGESYYWRAVDKIDSWLGSAVLFEDIKYILSDPELKQYSSLASDRKKAAFFHAFWNLRNPSPAARTNVRLAEHARRMMRAEHEFEFFGFRTHFNDPDKLHYLKFPRAFFLNQEFNDKGLVYIRHGDPDDVQRTIGDDLNESWLYNARADSPRRIFYFTQTNATGNNWRLTSFPEDPQMWENLVMWDSKYSRLINGQALDRGSMEEQVREESGETVSTGLSSDENKWKKGTKMFDLPHSINTFRNEGGKTLLNVSYALPVGEIAKEAGDSLKTLRVEVGVSMNSAGGGGPCRQSRHALVPRGKRDDRFFRRALPVRPAPRLGEDRDACPPRGT